MNRSNAFTVAACLLFIFCLLCPTDTMLAQGFNAKRFRGHGGWTLNSIGYNGGLGALRKFLAKRSGFDLPDDNQRSADLSDGQFNADDLLDDFLEFLKLKENGLLERDLLQCVIAKQAGRFEENANA